MTTESKLVPVEPVDREVAWPFAPRSVECDPNPGATAQDGVERFTQPYADRRGDDIFVTFDAPQDEVQPFILDVEHATALRDQLSAAIEPTPTIPAGMVPWHGGDSAPKDWDGGAVWTDEDGGYPLPAHAIDDWGHKYPIKVIAYTPKAPASQPQGEVERIIRHAVIQAEGIHHSARQGDRMELRTAIIAEAIAALTPPDRAAGDNAIIERARPGKIDPCEYCFGVTRHDADCRALQQRTDAGEKAQGLDAKEGARSAAIRDALSGWKYIRQNYGDLPGVGWDRVQYALEGAI